MCVYTHVCMCVYVCLYDVRMCMMCMHVCMSIICMLTLNLTLILSLTLSTNFAYIHETDSHNTMRTHVVVPKNMTFYPMQGTTWFNLNIFFKVL